MLVFIVRVSFAINASEWSSSKMEVESQQGPSLKNSPLSKVSVNVAALKPFKQLGFDDQHGANRLSQTDVTVHHAYHKPQDLYKPHSSYGSSSNSGGGHVSSSFQSSSYFSGGGYQQQMYGNSISSNSWPAVVGGGSNVNNNEMSKGDYKHQSQSHPNDILSNVGIQLPSEQILGKLFFYLSIYIALTKYCVCK